MNNWKTMIPEIEERILCAAIWYKDAESVPNQPINIDKGIVISGWRHGSIIASVKAMFNLRSVRYGPDSVGETVQGFLTSKNRFLNRQEAHKLFIEQGYEPEFNDELYSEDLY